MLQLFGKLMTLSAERPRGKVDSVGPGVYPLMFHQSCAQITNGPVNVRYNTQDPDIYFALKITERKLQGIGHLDSMSSR